MLRKCRIGLLHVLLIVYMWVYLIDLLRAFAPLGEKITSLID